MSGAYGSSHWLYDAEVFQTGQSLKFNDDDSAYLSRTPASASNRKTFTLSVWVKRSALASQNFIFSTGADSNNRVQIGFENADNINIECKSGGSTQIHYITTRLFRDVSAWYHLVFAFDTTNGTAGNRFRLYVNGTEETSFGTETNPSQNADLEVNKAQEHFIGKRSYSSNYFDGYMADVHFIDGQALDPTSFIKTENNQLKPKEYFGSYGTNGFRLNFQDDLISEGFNTVTYRGNGATQSISGLGFKPDGLVWIKERSQANDHVLIDSVRGISQRLESNNTDAEVTLSPVNLITSIDADGFSLGANNNANENNQTYVGWCWEAGGIPTATNSAGAGATPTAGSVKIDGVNKSDALAGSIAATRLSANTARGFSITSFAGTGSAGTISHGLSAAPELIIVKNRSDATKGWPTQVTVLGNNYLELNTTNATFSGSAYFNNTAPTSSVFSVGTVGSTNASGNNIIAYCFHSVSGYSSIGSFTGNGSSTGPTVTVGFRPALVICKRTDSAISWVIFDSTRDGSNPVSHRLNPNTNSTEGTNVDLCNFTDTGFEITTSDGIINASSGTYIFMAFADTREAAFFRDVSGNNNNFTPNNLEYRDSMIDTPLTNFSVLNPLTTTAGTYSEGNTRYLGASAWRRTNATYAVSSGKWYWEYCVLSAPYSSRATNSAYNAGGFGLATAFNSTTAHSSVTDGVIYTDSGYFKNFSGSYTSGSAGTITSIGDIIGFAVNLEDNTFTIYKNNSSEASGTIGMTAGTEITPLLLSYNADYGKLAVNFGQDSSFSGAKIPQGNGADGEDFYYTPPTGYKSLQLSNLPTPAIADPTTQFNTVLYTGNGSSRSITGVGFGSAPDFVWFKARSAAIAHLFFDSVRGATKYLQSNSTSAEGTGADSQTSFDSDGFSVGADTSTTGVNQNSTTYAAWNWLAGGASPSKTYVVKVVSDSGNKYRFDDFGTSAITLDLQEGGTYTFDQSDSSNSGHPFRFSTTANGTHGGGSAYTVGVTTNGTAGSAGAYTRITVAASAPTLYYYCTVHSGMGGQANTNSTHGSTNLKGTIQSTVSANTTAGFSIIKYTGNGSNSTIGHGLSSPVEALIIKERNATSQWVVGHHKLDASAPFDKGLYLDDNRAVYDDATNFNDTAPTSTVFSVGTGGYVNDNNNTYICYAFHSVESFSKVGSYVGNGNADGPFISTNFKVSWILIKNITDSGEDWEMYDATRDPFNVTTKRLKANTAGAEVTSTFLDFVSNGVKVRNYSGGYNKSGKTFIYLAFASAPFKTTSAR